VIAPHELKRDHHFARGVMVGKKIVDRAVLEYEMQTFHSLVASAQPAVYVYHMGKAPARLVVQPHASLFSTVLTQALNRLSFSGSRNRGIRDR